MVPSSLLIKEKKNQRKKRRHTSHRRAHRCSNTAARRALLDLAWDWRFRICSCKKETAAFCLASNRRAFTPLTKEEILVEAASCRRTAPLAATPLARVCTLMTVPRVRRKGTRLGGRHIHTCECTNIYTTRTHAHTQTLARTRTYNTDTQIHARTNPTNFNTKINTLQKKEKTIHASSPSNEHRPTKASRMSSHKTQKERKMHQEDHQTYHCQGFDADVCDPKNP